MGWCKPMCVAYLLLIHYTSVVLCSTHDVSPEMMLYEQLSANYSRHIRPVTSSSDRLIVNMTMHFIQLLDLDEKREVLDSVIWIKQEWYDAFFKWDPANHDGVKVLILPASVIWVPDVVIYNLVGDARNMVTPFLGVQENVAVWNNGKVVRFSPFSVLTSCPVFLRKFPFDKQTCDYLVGSWAHGIEQVYYRMTQNPIMTTDYPSADWDVLHIKGRELIRHYNYSEPRTSYSFVVFSLSIQRRAIYHLTYLIIPSMMLNMIVSCSFFLPPEAGERVSLGLTSFLAYSVFIMIMADKIPESTMILPLISILFLINMTLTMLTILWSVFTIRTHFRLSQFGTPPRWLLRIAIAIESTWCSKCIKKRQSDARRNAEEMTEMINEGFKKTSNLNGTNESDAVTSKDCVKMISTQKEITVEEDWRKIMCAADRILFCLFMTAALSEVVLIFLASAN